MVEIRFTVDGLPPKKGGDLSMWGPQKGAEVKRLILLRRAAVAAMEKDGPSRPFSRNISLSLEVRVARNDRTTGDLDTFVAGICDGLMQAGRRAAIDPSWDSQPDKIHPKKTIAIKDDSEVMSIQARKRVDPRAGKGHYTVTISGEV